MTAYFDTAVLAKSYFPEENSEEAEALIQRYSLPLALSHLQELEIRTAGRLKVFRKEISKEILEAGLLEMEQDLNDGILRRPVYEFGSVYRKAETLSVLHVAETGCRTLDVLHVATALVIGANEFVSFDQRQRNLAKKAGLKVKP